MCSPRVIGGLGYMPFLSPASPWLPHKMRDIAVMNFFFSVMVRCWKCPPSSWIQTLTLLIVFLATLLKVCGRFVDLLCFLIRGTCLSEFHHQSKYWALELFSLGTYKEKIFCSALKSRVAKFASRTKTFSSYKKKQTHLDPSTAPGTEAVSEWVLGWIHYVGGVYRYWISQHQQLAWC